MTATRPLGASRGALRSRPRRLVPALASAAVALALGLAGCSSDDDAAATSSAVATTQSLTSTVPAPNGADTTAAATEARKAGQGLRPGSLRRPVGPQVATGGWSLWSFRTAGGTPAQMVLQPDGAGATWSGCRRKLAIIDRCVGAAAPPSTLLVAGRAAPQVAAVLVITRSGARRPAVLGDGGWLYHTDAVPAMQENPPGAPRWVEALDASGTVLKRIGMAP